jgi:cardiolipin synthase A/B
MARARPARARTARPNCPHRRGVDGRPHRVRGVRWVGTFLVAAACLTAGCSVGETSSTGTSTTPTRQTTGRHRHGHPAARRRRRVASAGAGRLRLITEPDAGIAPLLDAIARARHSVDLVMYELEDPQVDAALAADAHRGVHVRVLLDGGYYGAGSAVNQPAYSYLRAHFVPVRWSPSHFALTHEKTMVVDGTAYIMTLNFTRQYYASDRDFAVVDSTERDVAAIERTFNADWLAQPTSAPAGADLVWSPGSEPALLSLIGSATGELDIYNEEMADTDVERALEAAARRDVRVRVMMTDSSEWSSAFARLTAAGVQVRTYAPDATLYIHAKMILTGGTAFIGSQNFSETSLQRNRELGILISAPGVITSLRQTFDRDFAGARPFTG